MMTSHPFTAASARGDGVLEFWIKPANGMSGALARRVVEAGMGAGTAAATRGGGGSEKDEGEKDVRDVRDVAGGGVKRGLAQKGMQVRVTLDGPYGGISGDIGAYDRVVLIAGGSGMFPSQHHLGIDVFRVGRNGVLTLLQVFHSSSAHCLTCCIIPICAPDTLPSSTRPAMQVRIPSQLPMGLWMESLLVFGNALSILIISI